MEGQRKEKRFVRRAKHCLVIVCRF